MSLFLEFHLIQNFAPSNLNRDDTGAPKDAIFGGQRRARVSSQCFKRAIRLTAAEHALVAPEHRGIRTKKLKSLLVERLATRDAAEAAAKVEVALAAAGLKIKDDGKTQYLLFLGENEIAGFAALIEQHWDELTSVTEKKSKKDAKAGIAPEIVKKAKTLLDGGKAVDVALFGRMLADLPSVNQDAACQVAHAISTHRVEREFDYFTAVDDKGDEDETGAGMIGQVEFNSATLYRYAVLDVNKLLTNLQGDLELTLSAIEAFTEASIRAIPTGKQNSFAAHNAPEFIGVSLRHTTPLNLANAFEKPVLPRTDKALTALSVERLAAYEDKLAAVYAAEDDQWLSLDLTGEWPAGKGEVLSKVAQLVRRTRELAANGLGSMTVATLLLRLQGPMQSWGTTSRFDERDTQLEPSKSGVLGLVCAALGRDRSEPVDDLAALRMGVRVDREGVPLRDYQTATGVVIAATGKSDRERTVVSPRFYLSDAIFLVGLEGERTLLERIQAALAKPFWPLSLGRKSFVPSIPVHIPGGLVESSLQQALSEWPFLDAGEPKASLRGALEDATEGVIRLDQPVAPFSTRRFGPRFVKPVTFSKGGEHASDPVTA